MVDIFEFRQPTRRQRILGNVKASTYTSVVTGLAAALLYLAPEALAEHEVGRTDAKLQPRETVSHAIGVACTDLIGQDFDLAASIQASTMVDDRGQRQYVRFERPPAGTEISVVCVSKDWEFMNDLPF